MSHRYLPDLQNVLQTECMRLPQSSRQSLFLFAVFVFFASLLPIQARTTQQLSSSPANLRFGSVAVSQTEAQFATLKNNGTTSVTISAVTVNAAGFSVSGLSLPTVLGAGQTTTLTILFAPTKTGWISGSVTVTSTASNSILQIGLHANATSGSSMTASPSSISFGQVTVGNSSSQSLVLTNTSSGSETLNAFQLSGSGFAVSGATLPMTLNKGQSLTVTVTFSPSTTGIINGSLFISGPNLNVPLTGTGATSSAGQLTVSPASLSFGNVDIGSSTTQPATLSATGGSVTVSSASSSSSQFSISGTSFPFTLNSGQSAQVSVVYAPTTAGPVSATVTFTTSTNAKGTESESGTGITPTYSVDLSWNASTSSVTGYNVYRGTTAGSYTKINSTLDPSTTYTDNTVTAGTTYYYAATAVNSSGQESSYSSPIQVTVP